MDPGPVTDAVDDIAEDLRATARTIWANPEISLHEDAAAETIAGVLREDGFDVTHGVGDLPTAIVATYGEGSPAVGFLGEYDALPGLSQTESPENEPREPGGPGHGCGHNLLGVGSLGAALAVKRAIASGALEGRVVYYGCPAEEIFYGKVYMASHGVFEDLDAALSWHAGQLTWPRLDSLRAIDSVRVDFTGGRAGGGAPVDAVQLLTQAVTYCHSQEYFPEGTRVDFSVPGGASFPNIETDAATVWYYLRAPDRRGVTRVREHVETLVDAMATATGTTGDLTVLTGASSVLHNEVLAEVIHDQMTDQGPIPYDGADRRIAGDLRASLAEDYVAGNVRSETADVPEDVVEDILASDLYATPLPTFNRSRESRGSTDIAAVSRRVPLGRFRAALWPVGVRTHQWQTATASGTVGISGVPWVATVLARTAAKLMDDPDTLAEATAEFEAERVADDRPADVEPVDYDEMRALVDRYHG